ncbi:MAG: choice-of-anchor Q domain-containing protein [Thermoanaerobaculia bacterium]
MRKLLAGTLIFAAVAGAEAATITVNSLADIVFDDGACTLREAAAAADSDMASGAMPGECDAGSGADVIEFGAPLTGTITLGSTLTVTSSVEIDGPADRSITIAGGAFQLLAVDDGSAATAQQVALRRLTFSGGQSGIVTAEKLVVYACTITGFTVTGTDPILAVTFDGTLLLSNTTISGNDEGSTFATVTAFGPTVVIHSTITANTGDGILGDSLHVVNSVIADNTGDDCFNAPVLAAGNFFGDATCDGVADGDPMLAGLADNGLPTLTHGLLLNSPLRDAADDAGCLAADQRGQDRALDGDGDLVEECDVGAVEVTDDMTVPVRLQSFTIE